MLSIGALSIALAVVPVGFAYGQDYGAIERRLGEAVANGEITLAQAEAMMNALNRPLPSRHSGHGEKGVAGKAQKDPKVQIEERLAKYGRDLRAQIESGELTGEEARQKYRAAEENMQARLRKSEEQPGRARKAEADHERSDDHSDGQLDQLRIGIERRLEELESDLRQQVGAGELDAEDAKAKYEAAEKAMWGRYRQAEAAEAKARDRKGSQVEAKKRDSKSRSGRAEAKKRDGKSRSGRAEAKRRDGKSRDSR
ncbi:MAG: hypothetical protein MK209_03240 [Planctomycetes bacterium]|nr:hypothetical protein [Planctomycetota bacterium]